MRSVPFLAPLMLVAVAATLASTPRIRAADVNDLNEAYSGGAHHVSVAADEDENITLVIQDRQSNGKFSGQLGGIAVTGKVTSTGKVTFAGKTGGSSFKQGKAQLSATGRFLVGSFVWQSSDSPASGKYIFSLDSEGTSGN